MTTVKNVYEMADDEGSEIGDATDPTSDSSFTLKGVESIPGSQREENISQGSRCANTPTGDKAAESEGMICTDEEEEAGYMGDVIANGLSQLGRSAPGTMQVFLTLDLSNQELSDISALKSYEHVQTVIISHNNLTDLTPLGYMTNLIKLDASYNKLTTLLDFQPPKNLLGLGPNFDNIKLIGRLTKMVPINRTLFVEYMYKYNKHLQSSYIEEVDVSHNAIEELADLSCHCHLVTLILDYNNIEEIKGLPFCHCLKKLSLGHNKLQRMSGLTNLPLTYLNLSYNNIRKVENLESLKYLQVLDLSGNYIRSLKGLQNHDFLQEINLEGNQIIDIAEIRYIRELRLLRNLNLCGNPIQEMPDYRLSVLFRLQMLVTLDNLEVSANEKVHATNMFNPPRDVIAARDHMVHVVRSLVQPVRVFDSTLTSMATPYPMLILTGPSGSGKRNLTKRLCQEFPDYFGLGVSTTTRPPRKKEEDGIDYFFISQEEFEKDVMEGKFLQTAQSGGYLYGVSREAVEAVARRGLACAIHMELEGVLSLKNTSFEPRYVLILPETAREHERRLREHLYYSESLIAKALARVELYVDINREKPGFFEMTIINDDLHEAYRRLKLLVLEYLGLSPTTTTDSELITNSFTNMTNGSRVSEDAPTNSSTTTTTNMSRAWSRPRSDVSNSLVKTNVSFQSSKLSFVELESLERRRTMAKAALAGIPYVSKKQLGNLRGPGYTREDTGQNLSTLLNLQRSMSAPVDFSNSYFSLLVNASSTNPPDLGEGQNGSELDSDSEETASSSTPSSARAFSPNMSRADSEDIRDYSSSAESLRTFQESTPSGSGVREELLGNAI